jgi:glycosyltransferase involved in cell wall biosynthesis
LKILFLATYFPRPLNPTIGTWALEQAKAFHRASEEAQSREGSSELRVTSGDQSAGGTPATSNPPPVTSFRVVSGNSWFPKIAGKFKVGIRAYSDCPRSYSWDGVEVDYLPMLFYPFGKLDGIFNRVGESMLQLGWWSIKGPLIKIVEEFQPDVVYAHHTVPNGYFGMRIHKETGIPFVVTDHESGEITACENFPKRRLIYEKVIRSAYRMVSVSESMNLEMLRVFPQANTLSIHNGVNLALPPNESSVERRESSAAPCSSPATSNSLPVTAPEATSQSPSATDSSPSTLDSGPSTPLIILSCGMFYERKNFTGLIQAFNLVAEKYPNVLLRILGDGLDRSKVERERNKSPFKDRIELAGKASHGEVLLEMRKVDIFALIGWSEPFGVVFLEAMAAGLPVIACSDSGVAEVIHSVDISRATSVECRAPDGGYQLSHGAAGANVLDSRRSTLVPPNANGILVPPRDIEAAARALEFLILTPEARKQIGEAARQKIEADLTWDAVVGKYFEMFEQAILKK